MRDRGSGIGRADRSLQQPPVASNRLASNSLPLNPVVEGPPPPGHNLIIALRHVKTVVVCDGKSRAALRWRSAMAKPVVLVVVVVVVVVEVELVVVVVIVLVVVALLLYCYHYHE